MERPFKRPTDFDMPSEDSTTPPTEAARLPFLTVGVGASAGGLWAFRLFLTNLPEDSGMAFVLVQHLDPEHDSLLVELLGKHTNLPIANVEDGVEIAPDHV